MKKKATKIIAIVLAALMILSVCSAVALADGVSATANGVTSTSATTQKGEAKIRFGISGLSGNVSIIQLAVSFSGNLSYKSVEFLQGKNDPANGYFTSSTAAATANSSKKVTVGINAAKTPITISGDTALFELTFTGTPGNSVTVTLDTANSYYYDSYGQHSIGSFTSVTEAASNEENKGKAATVKIVMDKVTDFTAANNSGITLSVTDESTNSVMTLALDNSSRDNSVTVPTFNMPLVVLDGHSYTVSLTGIGYTTYTKSGVTFSDTLTITNSDFVPGDLNADGKVDSADREIYDGLTDYTIVADFNRDGRVDSYDEKHLPAAQGGTSTGGGSSGGGSTGGGGSSGGATGGGSTGGGGGGSTGGGSAGSSSGSDETDSRFDNVDTENGGSLSNFKAGSVYKTGAFSDVPSDAWYEQNVKASVDYNLFLGYGNGKFGVGDSLKMSEVLTLAARLHNIYYGGSGKFDQTQDSVWYQVYEDYAVKYGYAEKGQYDLTATATRAQFVAVISAALPDEALAAVKAVSSIPDVSSGNKYSSAIFRFYNAGILNGVDSKGTFLPDSEISREQVAAIITRIANPALRLK